MIATGRFVFLHLHKSGGTFVNHWLLRFFSEARELGYHLPRSLIPEELSHLPVVGLVRNPWSYYVSWYAFQSRMARPNALFRILSDGGTLGFEPTIRNMLDLGSGGSLLDDAVAALPQSYGRRGLNLPGPQLAAIRNSGLGFYSFLYGYIYGGEDSAQIVRLERMRDAFPALLQSLGVCLSEEAATEFAVAPPANRTEHGPYPEYYSEELRDLVRERDAPVIERYGYNFGE
jgi:hypothetical protein